MIRVGVIGLGMMGRTHLEAYAGHDDVEVVAVADHRRARLDGREAAGGNIDGQAGGGFDRAAVATFGRGEDLIDEAGCDVIDVCAPTPAHLPLAERAVAAGRHVLVEKPPARTYADARRLAELDGRGPVVMVGMCMRFWPGWVELKAMHDAGEHGRLLSLSLERLAAHPGGRFYLDADASGAALLDLHLHDADFVRHLLGEPRSVFAAGRRVLTDGIDHVAATYDFGEGVGDGPVVTAAGGWAMANGFPFTMRFAANFERATATFDLATGLTLHEGGESRQVGLPDTLGYAAEIAHFLDCVRGRATCAVPPADAAESVRLVEAEAQSITAGSPVAL